MPTQDSGRKYNSTLRSEQAANTRQRILDAAAECFAAAGFAGTSLRDIATAAGVSVETVKLNGPKSSLLIGAFEQVFAGSEGRENIVDREIGDILRSITDNDVFLERVVGFIAEGNRRASGLWAAFVAAASSDPVVREVLDDLLVRKRQDCRKAVAEFDRRGMISSDTARHQLADALSFLISTESHHQLVVHAGWSMKRYTAWLVEAVRRVVLGA